MPERLAVLHLYVPGQPPVINPAFGTGFTVTVTEAVDAPQTFVTL